MRRMTGKHRLCDGSADCPAIDDLKIRLTPDLEVQKIKNNEIYRS